MNVKGKIKDNLKARINIALFCNRWNIKLFNDGVCIAKPKPHIP
jgi:hypothetical protein